MYNNNSRRTGEGPMDFEWQEKGGPVDPKSPFLQFNSLKIDNSESPRTSQKVTFVLTN